MCGHSYIYTYIFACKSICFSHVRLAKQIYSYIHWNMVVQTFTQKPRNPLSHIAHSHKFSTSYRLLNIYRLAVIFDINHAWQMLRSSIELLIY